MQRRHPGLGALVQRGPLLHHIHACGGIGLTDTDAGGPEPTGSMAAGDGWMETVCVRVCRPSQRSRPAAPAAVLAAQLHAHTPTAAIHPCIRPPLKPLSGTEDLSHQVGCHYSSRLVAASALQSIWALAILTRQRLGPGSLAVSKRNIYNGIKTAYRGITDALRAGLAGCYRVQACTSACVSMN